MPSSRKFSGDRVWSLYLVRDPRRGEVVYIGISSKPKQRFNNHRSNRCSPLKPLVDELASRGMNLHFDVVFSGLTEGQARRAEMRLCFLHTQCNRHRFLSAPIDVVNSQDRVCAIGQKHLTSWNMTVWCNGCGKDERLVWRGRYCGPWLIVDLHTHICPNCKSLYRSDREEFEKLSRPVVERLYSEWDATSRREVAS